MLWQCLIQMIFLLVGPIGLVWLIFAILSGQLLAIVLSVVFNIFIYKLGLWQVWQPKVLADLWQKHKDWFNSLKLK